MSDGNFNRALLPQGGVKSGLAMGKRIARAQAIEAFEKYYAEAHPQASDAELLAERHKFLAHFPKT